MLPKYARLAMFECIEMFYNPKRRHTHNERVSPTEYEQAHFRQMESTWAMSWPGDGPKQVRISFQPPIAGVPTSIVRDGPWAWFRLLEQAEVIPSSLSDRFIVTFRIGERKATFELRANSVINPFTLTSLGEFRCPQAL